VTCVGIVSLVIGLTVRVLQSDELTSGLTSIGRGRWKPTNKVAGVSIASVLTERPGA
jgi:hypothetical protein